MADRPILFSAPMVRSLIAGRKTQTRRVIKPPRGVDPNHWMCDAPGTLGAGICGDRVKVLHWPSDGAEHALARLPCATGDRLWVKETWTARGTGVWTIADARTRIAADQEIIYRADGGQALDGWWSSLFMPREFSRLTLIVESVKVEQLQDISEQDAKAEGICACAGGWSAEPDDIASSADTACWAYQKLWCQLHGPAAWDANPWVAALTFRVVPKNIDAIRDTPPHPAGDQGATADQDLTTESR